MNWVQVCENDGHYDTTLSTQHTLLTACGAVRKMLQKAGSDAIVRVAYIKQTLQNSLHLKKANVLVLKWRLLLRLVHQLDGSYICHSLAYY